MRILRFVKPDDYAVEFHPYVTVVRGLTEDRRSELRLGFMRAVQGRTIGLSGLIEVHGVVLDLDQPTLDLLELDQVSADVVVEAAHLPGATSTDLARQVKAVERRLDELVEPRRDAEERVLAAEHALTAAESALASAPPEPDPEPVATVVEPEPEPGPESDPGPDPAAELAAELAAERERLAGLLATVEDDAGRLAGPAANAAGMVERLERELAAARERAGAVEEQRTRDQDAEASIREEREALAARLDPEADELLVEAAARLDAARERVAAELAAAEAAAEERRLAAIAEAEAAAARAAEADATRQAELAAERAAAVAAESAAAETAGREARAAEDRVAQLDAEKTELETDLALHRSFDAAPLRSALDAARSSAGAELVPSPEALNLADRLDEIERRLVELGDVDADVPPASELEASAARVAAARQAYDEVERETRAPTLDDDDRAEIEAAHRSVLEATDALDGALRKKRAESRLETARAAEAEVLERFGYRTYTDYLTGGGVADGDAGAGRLQQARLTVLAAEAEQRDLAGRVEREQERARLVADRERLRTDARRLLGEDVPDSELLVALAGVRVDLGLGDSTREVEFELERLGLRVEGAGMADHEILRMAADWLDEYQRGEEELVRREEELAALESRLAEARRHLVAVPAAGPAGEDGPAAPAAEPAPELVPEPEPPVEPEPPIDPEPPVEPEPPTASREAIAERQRLEDELAFAERRRDAHREVVDQLAALDARLAEFDRPAGESGADADDAVARLEADLERARLAADDLEAQRLAAENDVVRLRTELASLPEPPEPEPEPEIDHEAEARALAAAQEAAEAAEAARAAAAAERAETIAALESAVVRARDELDRAHRHLDDLRRKHDNTVAERASLQQALDELGDERAPVEEVEWYLLARMAAQRDVCFAGSVPLVVDHAFDQVGDRDLANLLERLERMAGAVQIVHLTNDARIVDWALAAGDARVAVVEPVELQLPAGDRSP